MVSILAVVQAKRNDLFNGLSRNKLSNRYITRGIVFEIKRDKNFDKYRLVRYIYNKLLTRLLHYYRHKDVN